MKATIEFSGMIHKVQEYEGGSAGEIVRQMYRFQDFDCLVRMGPQFGDDVSELEAFLDKFHSGKLTFEDLKNMNIELSVGTIRCIGAEE